MSARITKVVKAISHTLPKTDEFVSRSGKIRTGLLTESALRTQHCSNGDSFVHVAQDVGHILVTPPAELKPIALLDKERPVSYFFGVQSASSIQSKVHNQIALSKIKSLEHNIGEFKGIFIDAPESFGEAMVISRNKEQWIKESVSNLYEKGSVRCTLNSKLFGTNGESGMHTFGMVFDKNNKRLYIIDSLPSEITRQYQYKIKDAILSHLDIKPENIICSTRAQQSVLEYTCNNWTHANIEAVQNAVNVDFNNQ